MSARAADGEVRGEIKKKLGVAMAVLVLNLFCRMKSSPEVKLIFPVSLLKAGYILCLCLIFFA